ncbi:MAG: YncE family protein [Phenylobacterium sp.]
MRTNPPIAALFAAALALVGCSGPPAAAGPAPLVLERTIPLADVKGRIDHLAVDAARRRLFIAELGAGSVEAIDLATGRSLGRVGGLKEPQGLAFLPTRNELAVATGGDGMVRFYRADDLTLAGSVAVGGDADNLRIDPRSGEVIVGYGDGALGVIDAAARALVRRAPLPGHPESFQLDGERAIVNVPDAGAVVTVDLESGRELARWRNHAGRFNFPMALEPDGAGVAVAYRLPAKLALLDRHSGDVRQSLATCGDSDDAFFDAARHRLYVVCGGGSVDVFERAAGGYRPIARIATRAGARTGLFAPSLDRLYVAARAQGGQGAALLVFKPAP